MDVIKYIPNAAGDFVKNISPIIIAVKTDVRDSLGLIVINC
ncbi:MAG TPA: hypothetical protein VK071_09845 [Tissierellales bacterium]|nr:hypothetical protein [Tissierellales bacterium]